MNDSTFAFPFGFVSRRKLFRAAFDLSLSLLFVVSALLVLNLTIAAQEEPQDLEPPSVKTLSADEKTKLQGEDSPKKRTELALDFLELRLKRAEEAAAADNYRLVLDELGGYHALIDDTIKSLSRENARSGKVLSSYKNIEMLLRKHTPRLEIVRRAMPYKYGWHVQKLIKIVRDARSQAVEPLFGQAVS